MASAFETLFGGDPLSVLFDHHGQAVTYRAFDASTGVSTDTAITAKVGAAVDRGDHVERSFTVSDSAGPTFRRNDQVLLGTEVWTITQLPDSRDGFTTLTATLAEEYT